MCNDDSLRYDGIKFPKAYQNKNLAIAIACIAYKYGLTYQVGNRVFPKMKQVKLFIIDKCFDYFNVKISLKQISYLLRPQMNMFPYTASILIETIYNLLKEEKWRGDWKQELENYLQIKNQGNLNYEQFMLGNLPRYIIDKRDDFMNAGFEYDEIYTCFAESREKFLKKIEDISMEEHCKKNFPTRRFDATDIPRSVYTYQIERIYMKEEKGWNI